MGRLGVENGRSFGIVEDISDVPENIRFAVRPLSGDRFLVEHPFHGPITVGDGSVFSDKKIDTAAAILLDSLAYLADSRKLNRTVGFETRPNAGFYSQLSHCISLGVMGAEFGGGPLDIFDGIWNDAGHVYNGHQGDDNYQGHGLENLHDYKRGDFFTRSGVIDRFIEEGVLRPNGHGYHFGQTRLYIGTLLSEDEATVRRTFMSNKHSSRRMDNDRFQYNEEERLYTELFRHRYSNDASRVPLALANAALSDIQRLVVLEDSEGDQLVFSEPEIAARSALSYGEQNALHWCEPVQDLVNDLLNFAERYFFVCDDQEAKEFQYFYPRDYLHTSASLMFERFNDLASRDQFMRWLLLSAEFIAKDQRQKMANIIDNKNSYNGPQPADGIEMTRLSQEIVASSFAVEGESLKVVLPRGKMRTVDPRIITSKLETLPLSVIRPGIADEVRLMHRWIGNYSASIELPDLETSQLVSAGISIVNQRWPSALRRLEMPKETFQRNIAEANSYVRS